LRHFSPLFYKNIGKEVKADNRLKKGKTGKLKFILLRTPAENRFFSNEEVVGPKERDYETNW
jgi:hypothetical protein